MTIENLHKLLDQTHQYLSTSEIARHFEVAPSTVQRWLTRESSPKAYISKGLEQLLLSFEPKKSAGDFSFIDLFAGIGGIRQAFEHHGGHCVFTSEWNTYSQKTYASNYPSDHALVGDITKINASDIPNHDLLLAGFPCQPFSLAGVSKKNSLGRAHGFADETQGTLFFDVARILAEKQPKAFLLENVKNLKSHDKGRTFDVIQRTLTEELGYNIHTKILDAQAWTPQHRERIVIVGFKDTNDFDWADLVKPDKNSPIMQDILHRTDGTEPFLEQDHNRFFDHHQNQVHTKYTLSNKLWAYLQAYAQKHREKGNGFGYGLVYPHSVSRTLSARYHKDGSEILVYQGEDKNPRRLTPRECARLMGYPDDFKIPVSDTQAYQQFGNSVVMPVFKAVAEIMRPYLVNSAIDAPKGNLNYVS
ncbi:MAG: DNA (cytosine-5-)-methyltransferase [Thiotrichales bacterium]|nr:DNA (cytosine-5-)-methyltransferase [Thiotrichales bacterium]